MNPHQMDLRGYGVSGASAGRSRDQSTLETPSYLFLDTLIIIHAYHDVNLDHFSVRIAMIGTIRVEAENLVILLMEATSCVLVKLHSCAQLSCLIALLYYYYLRQLSM